MTQRAYPTKDELRRNFERELASVTTGGGLHSETWLDIETDAALVDIASAYPEIDVSLVTAARAAFASRLADVDTIADAGAPGASSESEPGKERNPHD
ncbi:hypothetical protein ACL02S_14630 [Nocardia sp. 004]|uniref:hypothetical protein n=1 Tax=Nocardia sp. 004 TaxID=3385978 RepID=UPI0039A02712